MGAKAATLDIFSTNFILKNFTKDPLTTGCLKRGENMEFVEKYIKILEEDYSNFCASKQFGFLVLKISYEIKLRLFKEARKTLEEILKLREVQSEYIPYLIRATFLLGETEKIETYFKDISIDKSIIDTDNIFYKLYLNYLKIKNKKATENEIKSLIKESELQGERLSIAYYLLALNSRDSFDKEKYLAAGYDAFDFNYSIVKEAFKDEILKDRLLIKDYTDFDIDNVKYIDYLRKDKTLDGELCVLGGGNTIGGSCYLLRVKDINILIDCGAEFGKNDELILPDFEKLKEFGLKDINDIDIAVVTHAHLDHCGGIIELIKRTHSVPIYATTETCDLMKIMLRGAGKERVNSEFEVDCAVESINRVCFDTLISRKIKGKTLNIRFIRAGHILGASSLYIDVDGQSVFFTGDFCLEDQRTVKGMNLEKLVNADIVITETTYGYKQDEDRLPRYIQEKAISRRVVSAIRGNKKVLVPAFALGRGQEVIKILSSHLKDNNERFDIYIDGQITEVCDIYKRYIKEDFKGGNVCFVNDVLEYRNRKSFIEEVFTKTPCCIVASSGMIKDGSASSYYAEKILDNEDALCILTGYQDEESVGRRLKELSMHKDQYIEINDRICSIRCSVKEYYLSAHSSISDIIKVIIKINPSKVFLIHGQAEKGEKTFLNNTLDKISGLEVCQSFNGETYKF